MPLNPQFEASAKSIFNRISVAKHPLIVSHGHPDGDTLGCALAFLDWFRSRGIKATAFCADPPPTHCAHLPGLSAITHDQAVLDNPTIDLVLVVDAGDLKVTGVPELLAKTIQRVPSSVNIDHHPSNPNFAQENLVVTTASSASEIVYEIFRVGGVIPSRAMANCLLTGILFDTSNFSNSATTVRCLEIASELVLRGASFQIVTRNIYHNKSLAVLKLWGLALERLRFDPATEVASTALFLEDFRVHQASEDSTGGISNLLGYLLGVPVLLVLREVAGGRVVGSYRATGDVDVAALAKKYGGGGHRKAAGFTVAGQIIESEQSWKVALTETIS
jgi:phosphoesterase RecJ-like protein